MGSIDPFKRLVKLAARAFYDDITTKGENQPNGEEPQQRDCCCCCCSPCSYR
ncbi:hypothetical protein OROHE_023455 [Orobanche hederae]